LRPGEVEIVPVKGYVKNPYRNRLVGEGLNKLSQALCQRSPPGAQSDKDQILRSPIFLHHLMGQAVENAADVNFGQDFPLGDKKASPFSKGRLLLA